MKDPNIDKKKTNLSHSFQVWLEVSVFALKILSASPSFLLAFPTHRLPQWSSKYQPHPCSHSTNVGEATESPTLVVRASRTYSKEINVSVGR